MKKTYYSWILLLATMAVPSCTRELPEVAQEPAATVDANAAWGEVCPGWVRIKLDESAAPLHTGVFTRGEAESGNPELDRIANMLGATEVRRVFADGGKFAERRRKYGLHLWYDVHFDESLPVTRAMSDMTSIPGISYAEPIPVIHLTYENDILLENGMFHPTAFVEETSQSDFNDPGLKRQWHYYSDGSINGTVAGADINLFDAWKIETGDPSVIVAIMDDGVLWTHEDLAANMWVNVDEIAGTNNDDDDNGYRDDIYGYNFWNNTGVIVPGAHGTHVGGTVAAVNNNGIGLCGVAGGDGTEGSGARLMSCQIQHSDQFANNRGIADAFVYAADNGAVISQNSWCNKSLNVLPESLAVAFDYFNENAGCDKNGVQVGPMKGGIILFSTGNDGVRTYYPAASEKVIGVTAMTADHKRGRYANYGEGTDIMAPGGYTGSPQIWSTTVGATEKGDYQEMWGTSMACPHVAGVAALIVSHFGGPGFTAEECRERLLKAYKPVGGYVSSGDLENVGVGLVDAAAALMDNPKTAPAPVINPSVDVNLNVLTVKLDVPADGNNYAVANILCRYINRNGEEVTDSVSNRYDVGKTAEYKFTVEYNMNYELTLFSQDRWGNVSSGVSLSVSTGNFNNRAPELKNNIPSAAAKYGDVLEYNLNDYFRDFNIDDGDVLTYEYRVSGPNMVAVTLEENILTVKAIAKGTCTIFVTATDLAGESVEGSFRVMVADGPEPSENTGNVEATLVVNTNPVDTSLEFTAVELANAKVRLAIYDSVAREILAQDISLDANGKCTVDVSPLAPGIYSLRLSTDNLKLSDTFVKK